MPSNIRSIGGNPIVLRTAGLEEGPSIAAWLEDIAAENIKQTALMAALANTTVSAALLADWTEVQAAIQGGLGPSILPIGTQIFTAFSDNHGAETVNYNAPWDVTHFGTGSLSDGETINAMFAQMHYCLPFATQFSKQQAFLYAIDGLPAGTYNVSMGFSWGTNVVSGKTYQFTLANALPAGGQLSGFEGAPDQNPSNWKVKAWSSPTATTATETVSVTEGSGGTSLGTFTAAGVAVPASGTPATSSSVTIDGATYTYYGLNSLHRVAYGNNRWLHSPLRQWLNADGSGWYVPATVFDRPPDYAGYDGFLSMLPDAFVAAMKPIAQVTATNYISDGGSAASPATDTTYDKVFLPSWEQHYLAVSQYYGGTAGLEGDAWEYWERVAGTTSPLPGSTSDPSTYHPEFVQQDLTNAHTARGVWLRSCYRGGAVNVAGVYASGGCGYSGANGGYYAAPACAIG